MTWFKIDDGFADHPKVDALHEGKHAEAALALWVLAGAWCAKQLTDGHVPAGRVRRFGLRNSDVAASELVRVGLWIEVNGGYQFHQWTEHQPTREDVLDERERKKKNQRESRRRRRQAGDMTAGHHDVTGDMPGDATDSSPVSHHGPTRPDPSRPTADAVGASASVEDEPESRYGRRLRDLRLAWRAKYRERFAMDAAGNCDAEMREALAVLESATGGDDEALRALTEAVLDGYFADDYLRRTPRAASARNFVGRLNALVIAAKQATLDADPLDYDPARHGSPKSPKNRAKWNAYIDRMAS